MINEDGEALHCDGRCPVDLNGVSRGCQGAQPGSNQWPVVVEARPVRWSNGTCLTANFSYKTV